MVLQDFLFLPSIIVNRVVSLSETDCTRNSASWLNYFLFKYSSRHNSVVGKTQHVHDLSPLCQSLHKNFIKPSLLTSNEGFVILFESSVYVNVSFLTY